MAKTEKVESSHVESSAKAEYRKLIEIYKKQNPVKYELKKVALEARLAAIE